MKLIKAKDGKARIVLTKKEWEEIGKKFEPAQTKKPVVAEKKLKATETK